MDSWSVPAPQFQKKLTAKKKQKYLEKGLKKFVFSVQ